MSPSHHDTPLRGRSDEVRTAVDDLHEPGVRVVALTGLAGVGKTRIAAAAAECIEAAAERMVVWVDVSRVPAAELLEPVIARRAGIVGWDLSAPGGLGEALDTAPRLVVLDGFDIDPSDDGMREQLGDLVNGCRSTRFLLTARTPHRIPGDRLVRVDPFPATADDPSGNLRSCPAVELFIDVSHSVGAITPTAHDLPAIAAVVDRLGGNPLAIELVASRTTAFSPSTLQELLARPTPNPIFASSVFAGAGELSTSIDWSIGQLDDAQAELLRDLIVFQGPVPVEAVEAVSDVDDVIGALSQLVDVHLVDADHGVPETTFSLPPIVREHLALVTPVDVRAELRRRHQRWAVELAGEETASGAGEAHASTTAVRLVEPDLMSALQRALDAGAAVDAGALVVALAPLWLGGLTHDTHLDLVRRTTTLLAESRDDDGLALVHGWHSLLLAERAAGATALDAIDTQRERALELARQLDPVERLRVLAVAVRGGRVYVDRGPFIECCDEARRLAREQGADALLARFEIWGGMLAHQEGDLDGALRLALAARERGHNLDDASLSVTATAFLRTLPRSTTLGLDLPSAAQIVEAARACDEQRVLLWMLPSASIEALDAGDFRAATEYDIELLMRARDAGVWAWTALPIINQAAIAAHRGDLARAARLHGMIRNHLHMLEAMLPPAGLARWRSASEEVRAALGARTYEAAGAAGAMLTPGDAAADVLTSARRFLVSSEQPPIADAVRDLQSSPLTARELEVLELLVAGDSNKDVARRLGISPKTVMHHTSSIYRKLAVRGRAEAVAWAVRSAA